MPSRIRLHTRLISLLLIVWISGILSPGFSGTTSFNNPSLAHAKAPGASNLQPSQDSANQLLAKLSPEEKVGQLFLVTFKGAVIAPNANIIDLIMNRHIGGVVLLSSNDNFLGGDKTTKAVVDLNRQLQQFRSDSTLKTTTDPVSGLSFTPAYIPLFIGLSQEGDGYPYNQILSGLTALPNEMALGATWKPEYARQVGNILGKELVTLGINLLVGPSLDILESPQTEGSNNLGTRTFGGDPFWVGSMGQMYIQGIHEGSQGQLAVIATHFPGHGGSDRLPEDEVATVRKSLEQLKSFELAPFFNVTGNAPSPEATTDGLLVSHIRYQGLQGNIRATTRPISLDPQALNLLMALPQFDQWRQNGGLIVSDNLGSQAVRRFYSLTSQPFDMPRRVALNAFLAGNDLLYVADFTSGDLDAYTATLRTLDFFAQKYREDTAFAQRVDASVLRILTLKYRLYGEFSIEKALPTTTNLAKLASDPNVTFEVARQAATLLSPSQEELDATIPDPPNQNDRIVIISDTRTARQCSQCLDSPLLAVRSLEEVILRRYGPQAGGQVTTNNLISYSLSDLDKMLLSSRRDSALERSLSRANWIVFAMLNASSEIPSYQTLSMFLAERPDLFQQKRLIVFAFNAPTFLDATNISKLTAYYCLYSKMPQFIDAAAYLLFQELRATGAPPVSVPGISYDLNAALFPDPNREILLELDLPIPVEQETTTTPTPTQAEVRIGDIIALRTGIILDHNGHPVPDGTPVDFVINGVSFTSPIRQSTFTQKGIARMAYTVNNPGVLEIHVESEPARSQTLKFDIPSPTGTETIPTPTEETPAPTTPPTPIPTATLTPIPTAPQPQVVLPPSIPGKAPRLADWLIAVLLAGLVSWVAYRIGSLIGLVRWGVRTAFLAFIGGLVAYSYLALQLPGSSYVVRHSIAQGVFLVTLGGVLLGILIALVWRFFSEARTSRANQISEPR